MRIGFFDSGLGGLLIAQSVIKAMPDYDYVYLGDTLHVPYGKRSKQTIYDYSESCVDYLFREQNCQLIVTACNTVSAAALRQLQQSYLPAHYPDRRILGVVVPTLEAAKDSGHTNIGVIATEYTINSNIYKEELEKVSADIQITQKATPLLVPLIEHDGVKYSDEILNDYLKPLKKSYITALILGCTHYPRMKCKIQNILGEGITILSQDDIIPVKLQDYLNRHPEHTSKLTRTRTRCYLVTDLTESYQTTAQSLCSEEITLENVVI